jgi:arsenate reductase
MIITIYYNPSCSTPRNTLAMIRQSGEEPRIIEYLKTSPSRARLIELIGEMGISVRSLLRGKGHPIRSLALAIRNGATTSYSNSRWRTRSSSTGR